jgi:uncharacterized membrane protein
MPGREGMYYIIITYQFSSIRPLASVLGRWYRTKSMKNFARNQWTALLVIALMTIFGLVLRSRLPLQVPTHWDLTGKPDQLSSRDVAIFLIPALTLTVTVIIDVLMRRSRRGENVQDSRKIVGRVCLSLALMLAVIHVGMLMQALDPEKHDFQPYLMSAFAVFLVASGNLMTRLKRNPFIGIRVPWTLASEKNWRATHLFAAQSMTVGGFAVGFAAFFTNFFPLVIGIVVVSVTMPVLYSYRFAVRNGELRKHK